MTKKEIWLAWLEQLFIAGDQLLNVFCCPPITGTISYADETLSARCYRAYRDGKFFGRIFMPPIDWVFAFKQGPEHCKNAYIKEFSRKNYPDEYQGGVPIFERRK